MKCENCGHEVLEPIISNYCTNCGKVTGVSKGKAALSPANSSPRPKFTIKEWNSAFLPAVASIIPVLVLSYFLAGTAAAIILTFLDFLLTGAFYQRASAYEFFEEKLRILEGGRVTEEIAYSQIQKISSSGPERAGQKYDGSFIISVLGPPSDEIEIPSNP